MDSHRETITVQTEELKDIRNITDPLRDILQSSDVQDGVMSVFPLHTSCAVFINDSDPNLLTDVSEVLETLIPENQDYKHNKTDPKQNAAAHLKSILTGHHVTLPITDGAFDFGRYHTVYYAEFDGTRPKEILVKTVGTTL